MIVANYHNFGRQTVFVMASLRHYAGAFTACLCVMVHTLNLVKPNEIFLTVNGV